ncbi:uncharacterized protein LOC131660927 [Vicia villosa]|uniref:uncharacterized protein LOC131660927 n=1 Tax=Vicia villosa TaxID=3911 RepID=UPI00273B97A3|nr:uncharacterized protein LOC131660927 [Vicia villosa]
MKLYLFYRLQIKTSSLSVIHPTTQKMNTNKAEAERLLEIGEELLQKRDLKGSRELAILVQETEPLLEGSDQILAIVDVLEAAEKPLNLNTHHLDWYAILQIDRNSRDSRDPSFIRKQYRTLALLLQPDKNPFSFAELAFKLVSDAWAVLSDPAQKAQYDRGFEVEGNGLGSFWTACPYCYCLYEYARVYEGCCLMCQKCDKSFCGVEIPNLPEFVPGEEAYYVTWGMFPMGFVFERLENGDGGDSAKRN